MDLLAGRRNAGELALIAHSTYMRAATKVSANIRRAMTAVISAVRMLRRARRRSMAGAV
jgi:hypothetical protein